MSPRRADAGTPRLTDVARISLVVLLLTPGLIVPAARATTAPPLRDVGKTAGLARKVHSWDVVPVDMDHDGWMDVIISHHLGRATIYRNAHAGGVSKGFKPMVTLNDTVHNDNDTHGCAAADINQDGLTDVICLTGADQGTTSKWNQLWIQDPAWTFTNEVGVWGVRDKWGRGRHPAFLDVNGDAYPDLFIGNDEPRQDNHLSPNRLYINRKDHFEQAHMGIAKEVGAQCVQVIDINRDGHDDLLVCGNAGLKMYVRAGSRFVDRARRYGLTTDLIRTARFVDLNGDGRTDLIGVEAHRVVVQLRRADRTFGPIAFSHALTIGHGLAIGDVNGRHGADIYVVQACQHNVNVPDLLLLNRGDGVHWSKAPVPRAVPGCGDVGAPLDFDHDGRADFVVLNGGYLRHSDVDVGPDQLLTMGRGFR
jgi:hypothetical protein